jgi:hypothetical protein
MESVLNTIKINDRREAMMREAEHVRLAQRPRPDSVQPADLVATRAAYLARLLGRPRTTRAARVDIPGG